MSPHLVLSIDFELRWGVQDKLGLDFERYRKNLEGSREVVPRMLELFQQRGVHATWATVGALACEGWDEWVGRTPPWPAYRDKTLAWNPGYREKDPTGRLYFARDLVDLVHRTPGQELASHTFSHAYYGEPGFERADALADTAAVVQLFQDKWGFSPTSFVFPRNQVAHTDVLAQRGFTLWRENPSPAWHAGTVRMERNMLARGLRLADAFLPLGTRVSRATAFPHRASYFVRFSLPSLAWKAHVRRLQHEAKRLREGEILHLWWHPHNLGAQVSQNIERLRTLLEVLQDSAPHATRFATMKEIASLAREEPFP